MPRNRTLIITGAVASLTLLTAVAGVSARPRSGEPADAPVISAISERMRSFVDQKEVAGATTLVATPDRILHLDAIGKADIGEGKAMRPDAIFWIASMTKPVTGTAVMMLQDEGKLSVDDLVEKHLPEFTALKTKDGKPARLTIRHLLTHTSGMSEISPNEARGVKNLAGVVPLYVAKPVQFEPGSRWAYCQSGINTAGRIVEVVSGSSFDEFIERRHFRAVGDDRYDVLSHGKAAPAARQELPPDQRRRARRRPDRFSERPGADEPRPFSRAERWALLNGDGLRAILPDDLERRRARWEALREARVSHTHDHHSDRRP